MHSFPPTPPQGAHSAQGGEDDEPITPTGTPPGTPSPETLEDDDPMALPDIWQHPKGPLRVLRGHNKTMGLYRWHYATATNRTIGCNILMRPDRCTPIDTTLDYMQLLTNSQECDKCGKQSRVPSKWVRDLTNAPDRATKPTSDTEHSETTTDDDETDTDAPTLNGE